MPYFFNYFMFRFSSVSLSVTLMFHFVSIVPSFDTCIFVKFCVNVIVFHVCRLVRATWKISVY